MVNRDAHFFLLSNKMAIPSEQQYYLKMERITWPSLGGSRLCKVLGLEICHDQNWTGRLVQLGASLTANPGFAGLSPGLTTYFREDFYGYSPLSAYSRRAVVSF